MLKNTLKKYLEESQIESNRLISIRHSSHSCPDWLIPPLFKENVFEGKILYASFGNSFAKIKSLLKRQGLGKSAKKQFEYLNLEDKLSEWVSEEYPIIDIKNDLYSKGFNGYECQFYIENKDPLSLEFYQEIFEYIDQNFKSTQNFIVHGLEFLILKIDLALTEKKKQQKNTKQIPKTINFYISLFFEFLLQSKFKKIIFSYNKDILKTVSNVQNQESLEALLDNFANLRLSILDLKSGYSKQMNGQVQFRCFKKDSHAEFKKCLKFKCSPDSIQFFERVKV